MSVISTGVKTVILGGLNAEDVKMDCLAIAIAAMTIVIAMIVILLKVIVYPMKPILLKVILILKQMIAIDFDFRIFFCIKCLNQMNRTTELTIVKVLLQPLSKRVL